MLDTFTKLKNPNFAGVARALGLWGQTVSDADQLETVVKDWLAQPGPALLHVHVNPMQLVMPPFMQGAGGRNGALFHSRHLAWPGRRRLGNGEGEFPLVEASSSPGNARCRGVAPLIDLPRSMSVVKHRCHGLTAVA
jgi:Thiamine pyrophosphate enzyme, C-terminal TPP binding domain